ncbi:hypothetical protein ACI780_17095 [Geodermatophilus sp. SYSU D00814]
MPIPEVHPPELADPAGRDPAEDEYSPAFAAWALLLTLGVLAGAIVVVWASAGWPVGAP